MIAEQTAGNEDVAREPISTLVVLSQKATGQRPVVVRVTASHAKATGWVRLADGLAASNQEE
jgi:hypothetical protein